MIIKLTTFVKSIEIWFGDDVDTVTFLESSIGSYGLKIVGFDDGNDDGCDDGSNDGCDVGVDDGRDIGCLDGCEDGFDVGVDDGCIDGNDDGCDDGDDDGVDDGWDGCDDGCDDGDIPNDVYILPTLSLLIPTAATTSPELEEAINCHIVLEVPTWVQLWPP